MFNKPAGLIPSWMLDNSDFSFLETQFQHRFIHANRLLRETQMTPKLVTRLQMLVSG